MQTQLLNLVPIHRGHFQFESGHHGDLWLDLAALFVRPAALRPFIADLARRLAAHDVEAVCGPLAGGAFVAQMIAAELQIEFHYAERSTQPMVDARSVVQYRIPISLRDRIRGKRIALVDDAINAGSAVGATLEDLRECGAVVVVLGALLVLGASAAALAAQNTLPLEYMAHLDSGLWPPSECPLCAAGAPLESFAAT